MRNHTPILSTKKLRATVIRQALLSGFEIMDYDFIEISFIDIPANIRENLVFTSRNAVIAFERSLDKIALSSQRHKVHCLHGETLKAVQNTTNIEIISVAKDAASLANKIIADKNIKEVSFICGNQRRNELPEILHRHQVNVEEIKVYETHYTSQPINHAYKAVIFFSPSAVESFFQTNILADKIACFCIGATTATSVKKYTDNPIIIASNTTQESVLDAVQEFFKKKNQN